MAQMVKTTIPARWKILQSFMRGYRTHPFPIFGALIKGVDLNDTTNEDITGLKNDVTRNEFILFEDQENISPARQIEIASWFGYIDDSLIQDNFVHPKAPHPAILRLSNDENEGHKGFGTSGFHIDGSFLEVPNSHSVYHSINTPTDSKTLFVSLRNVLDSVSETQRKLWDKLWFRRDKHDGNKVTHPVVYKHPITGQPTMCIHLGNVETFLLDKGEGDLFLLSKEQSLEIATDMEKAFYSEGGKFVYSHKWNDGDVLISDNLAVAHKAGPDSQLPVDEVGLRIFDRVVTRGTSRPEK